MQESTCLIAGPPLLSYESQWAGMWWRGRKERAPSNTALDEMSPQEPRTEWTLASVERYRSPFGVCVCVCVKSS